jgi:hypothetical protein
MYTHSDDVYPRSVAIEWALNVIFQWKPQKQNDIRRLTRTERGTASDEFFIAIADDTAVTEAQAQLSSENNCKKLT